MAGRPKKIKKPSDLWEYFVEYRTHVKANPKKIKDWVGKDAREVTREKERPVSMDGFENWLADKGVINDLGDYLKNKDGRYSEFAPICSRIKKNIREDHTDGGMTGIYNPSVTQRLTVSLDPSEADEPASEITVKIVRNNPEQK